MIQIAAAPPTGAIHETDTMDVTALDHAMQEPADTGVEASSPATEPSLSRPTNGEIALEAYLRYLGRGAADGHAIDDWLEAEQALRERYAQDVTGA